MENMENRAPVMDEWLKEAKAANNSRKVGMYLIHNGVVREDSRAKVRYNAEGEPPVRGMRFSADREKADLFIQKTLNMPGIFYARVWLNEGLLNVGDDIMYVLVGGDTRPHVIDALEKLVAGIKTECVKEEEMM